MHPEQHYIQELENLIFQELLPIREKYFKLLGKEPPDLPLSFELKLRQRVPALFQPKKPRDSSR